MANFSTVINKLKQYKEHKMYSIKTTTQSKKIFLYSNNDIVKPKNVLSKKISCLESLNDLPLYVYDVEYHDKECIEYININEISWKDIEVAINNLTITNNNSINPKIINASCDLDVHKLTLTDNTNAYILNKHTTINSAFRNKSIFNLGSELNCDNILSFNDFPDAIICDNYCYIIHEDKFCSIFNYREKLNVEVENGKEQIEKWEFLDNSKYFYEECNKNYNTKRAIVKVLNKKGLEFLEQASPKQIKDKIKKHEELNVLKFDNKNKIIVDENSAKIILKILTNKIGLDLFTESIFGTEDKENDKIT